MSDGESPESAIERLAAAHERMGTRPAGSEEFEELAQEMSPPDGEG
jgi:hypothetical protein